MKCSRQGLFSTMGPEVTAQGAGCKGRRGHRSAWAAGAVVVAWLVAGVDLAGQPAPPPEPVLMVVMDPLAKELACACVKGHGQRDYRKLASNLGRAIQQRVEVEFSDDLGESMAGVGEGREVIVAGSRSVVAHGAEQARLKCRELCELTDRDGETTATASFVVRAKDPARELKDLARRQVFFGLVRVDELHAAAEGALRAVGIGGTVRAEGRGSYTEAALDLLDSKSTPPPAAVIPSYALPLLEGCGSVGPGDLRVIGRTEPVPFIRVFVSESVPAEKQKKIMDALVGMRGDAQLVEAMESRDGFRPVKAKAGAGGRVSAGVDWPDWRGAARSAHVPRLPARLSAAKILWKKAGMQGCLAGLSVSGGRLFLAERDFAEEHDVYRCLDAESGELLWRVEFVARGKLDYGQSPRATPVIHDGRAYLLGAFGGLRCVEVTNGRVIWERELLRQFGAELPTWGMCSTPLVMDDILIVNPGGVKASLVALDRLDGRTRWATPGLPAAYGAFICGEFGGRRQFIGYDQESLGGWDVKTGERLWRLVPPVEGDFNVPTPAEVEGAILVSTENNGTRLYRFDDSGRIIGKPAAEFSGLSPSTASPVVTCGRVFGAHAGLHCLDVRTGLKPVWHHEEETLGDHASLIADGERVLVLTMGGELILLDAKADRCVVLSRMRLFTGDVEVYSHPAVAGPRLYARGGSSVVCVDLGTE